MGDLAQAPTLSGFPSAEQVATALVEAARLVGESPVACAQGAIRLRCRPIAAEALRLAFPEARRAGIYLCVGWSTPHSGEVMLAQAKRRKWWSDYMVDHVVGSLIPEEMLR